MAFVNLTMDPTDPRVFERKFNQMVRQIKGNSTQGNEPLSYAFSLYYLTFRQNQTQGHGFNTKPINIATLMKEMNDAVEFRQKTMKQPPQAGFAVRATPDPRQPRCETKTLQALPRNQPPQ